MRIQGLSEPACTSASWPPESSYMVSQKTLNVYPTEGVIHAHNPYHISWQTSDIPTLKPEPPVRLCESNSPTWVPGTYTHCDWPSETDHHDISIWMYMIVLPVGLVLALAGCCTFSWFHSKRKRLRAEARREGLTLEEYRKTPLYAALHPRK